MRKVIVLLFILLPIISGCKPITLPATESPVETTSNEQAKPLPASEVVTAACLAIDDGPLTFEFDAEWQVGETKHFELIKSREEIGRESPRPAMNVATDIQITVLEASATGFVLEWKYGETRLLDPAAAQVPGINELLEIPQGTRIEYETTKWGDFKRLRNPEEVQATVNEMIDALFAAMIKEGQDQATIEKTQKSIKEFLSNLQQIEALYTREVQLLHGIYGFNFDNTNLITFESQFPNLLGGQPIPNVVKLHITNFSREQDCLHLDWTTEVNQEKARESIIEGLTKQAAQLGVEPPKGDEFPEAFGFSDHITLDFAIAAHWPTQIEFLRVIKIGPLMRTDRTTIIAKD